MMKYQLSQHLAMSCLFSMIDGIACSESQKKNIVLHMLVMYKLFKQIWFFTHRCLLGGAFTCFVILYLAISLGYLRIFNLLSMILQWHRDHYWYFFFIFCVFFFFLFQIYLIRVTRYQSALLFYIWAINKV